MGEIKSTVDLVMARTRHLSMSAEEKARQRQADFGKRLQGLLQQYADGILTVDRLRDRIRALQEELTIVDQKAVMTAVIQRMEMEANRPWLTLLADLKPDLSPHLEGALARFQNEKEALSQRALEGLRLSLAQQSGIAGTAVVPNPAKDPEYLQQRAALWEATQNRLAAIVNASG
jgi:hypothetical protein